MSCAIVAIPNDRESVWKYSSEKIPHMTLLFLGEQKDNPDLPRMVEYIQHVCDSSIYPFGMPVESRGVLGLDSADVLFFAKDRHDKSMASRARQFLLDDPGILAAYNSVTQYPDWTPHLTMGYPKAPAIKDDREYPGFGWIEFDRIAIWFDDFSGPTFKLKYPDQEATDMAMSDKTDAFFEHFGVKGMHWGTRKDKDSVPAGETRAVQKKPGTKVATSGGKQLPAHEDAVKAALARQKAKSSTTDSLSNAELQALVTRMNLEQQLSKLSSGRVSPGKKFVTDLLTNAAKQEATKFANAKISELAGEAAKKAASR